MDAAPSESPSEDATTAGADLRVPRRATALAADGRDTRLLADWRSSAAYVLLGDPGAGKSESLRAEAAAAGTVCVSARDFIALGIEPGSASGTLFIDGLDEVRAGAVDGRASLDQIRARLQALGRPRFRLSCREHDWRSQPDLDALARVAPGGVVEELHLEPLSREEQHELVEARSLAGLDAPGFFRRADELNLAGLFGNPLLLDLTVRAVAKGGWPETRCGIYELACRELATERSPEHLAARPLEPGDVDRIVDDAGLLCAVLLLSGKASLSRKPDPPASCVPWHTLPAEFALATPTATLASKIFATTAGESSPRHRSIAEYLAGKAIARRLQSDLPVGRVLSLVRGGDGHVVEPLRGLLAWLAVHDPRDRQELARLDPLGVVLNGDVAAFSLSDKVALLEALRDEAKRNEWFRNRQWVSYPFAPLATPDMKGALEQVLADHSPDRSHQVLIDCVLDALNHSPSPIPELQPHLEAWVEDSNAAFANRMEALRAWKRSSGLDVEKARRWLALSHDGSLVDSDARLSSELLADLYPLHVGPSEVLRYWRPPLRAGSSGITPFWFGRILDLSRPQDFAVLADSWSLLKPAARPEHEQTWVARLRAGILANALEHSGDQAGDERLISWLRIGLDEHGFSKLDRDAGGNRVAAWLTDRPQRIKAVVALGWSQTQPNSPGGRRHFWESQALLHGARLPSDWLHWNLEHASATSSSDLAGHCLSTVARASLDAPTGFDLPTMEQIELWVEDHSEQWPDARDWLSAHWTSPLESNWQRDGHLRTREHEEKAAATREQRRVGLFPYLDAVLAGSAPPRLMHDLARAHEDLFIDISGDTALERVQNFLGADEGIARSVIASFPQVLDRRDLPTEDEVFALDRKRRYHLLQPAALLAARIAYEHGPGVVGVWSDSLLGTLAAGWLIDGTGEVPKWYEQAAEMRPSVLAPILVRYASPRLRRKGNTAIAGLWLLSKDPKFATLARLTVPQLLEGFPQRASESVRREFNSSLLGALYLLEDDVASSIVRRKISNTAIDAVQRICWFVSALHYEPDAAQRLAAFVGRSQRRAVAVGVALHEQRSLGRLVLKRATPQTLSTLIELLAPMTRSAWPEGAHWVGEGHERIDTVRGLVDLLSADPTSAASSELRRLASIPSLGVWHRHLRYALQSQAAAAREAHYVHSAPDAVARTIANAAPASQADLKSLLLDHLGDIEALLRGADTSALRFFWREQTPGLKAPLPENDCRDLLLERLRPRLAPLAVALTPERRAAAEKRADLRAEFHAAEKQHAVPVEIKKDSHRDVWSAWRDQLQALYSIDPATGGHGIYLVLWFGHKPQASPEGMKPNNAAELQVHLTDLVPLADRARLAIMVMDMSQL